MCCPPTVYPPMTNSCPRLTRIFCHAPERWPDSYRLRRRFAHQAFQPLSLHGLDQCGQVRLQVRRITNRFIEFRQHLFFQQYPPRIERLSITSRPASISTSNT